MMLRTDQMSTSGCQLALTLFDRLDCREIVYCHWKSNELLEQGLSGETDLDLLVARDSFASAVQMILECGFKRAGVRGGPGTPGVLHFYGYDRQTTDLIHVHLYAHLLTGESLVKTHILPCEALLLAGNERLGNVRVPQLPAECAVALLRHFLKNGSLLHIALHGRSTCRSDRDKILFPDDEAAAISAYRALAEHYQAVDQGLFLACYRAIVEDAPAWKQWLLGIKLRRAMSGCSRFSAVGRLTAYGGLITAKLKRVMRGKIKNKVLDSGGITIAFIGGDATGKSTLVNATRKWLSSHLAVRTLHIGKPPASVITYPLHVLLPLARRLFPQQRHQSRQIVEEQVGVTGNGGKASSSLLYALRAVALAWDRSKHVRRAQRYAAAGDIVICDRYPSDESGATDGPRLRRIEGTKSLKGRAVDLLARYEHRLYQRISPPDVALRLHVSIETAKLRNRLRVKDDRHSDENLELRHRPNHAWVKTGTKVSHHIDTELPLEETLLCVKNAIWQSL